MVKSNPDPDASAQANIDEAAIRLGELIEDEALAAGQDYSIDVSLNPNRSNDLARRMPRRTTGAQFVSQRLHGVRRPQTTFFAENGHPQSRSTHDGNVYCIIN